MPTDALHIANPLVSVIIPCYNHARYLPKAIESVMKQTYRHTEIIVVDDGSSDNTKAIAEKYPEVKYVHQQNQGLSAARNTGVQKSTGNFLLFLDADDWLYPRGIELNVTCLLEQKELAFVSGTFDAVYENENAIREGVMRVNSDHYCHFLKGNYIGMIATVLFQRWVFKEFQYDTTLKNCEDYDLYLKIARKYPVHHHLQKIAVYRFHSSNMSGNIPAMLDGTLKVLARQQELLQTPAEKTAYQKGYANWKKYYCEELYKKQIKTKEAAEQEVLHTLFTHKPRLFYKYILKTKASVMKSTVKKIAPAFSLRLLHKMGLYKNHVPAIGNVAAGDFSRTNPFSKCFGYDRGGPVDRYYIENFLLQEAGSIKGRVLEIGDNEYTLRFGGKNVEKSEILHVNDNNPQATIIGDISHAPHIPDNAFDCIVLTQTLHLIYDFKAAMQTCHRILKPGGTLLLTVPGITPIDQGEWKETWFWSFTDKAMHKITTETFPNGTAKINTHGNVHAAAAFLYGMGLPEIPRHKLDHHDPHYQVIITVSAQKAL